jgi:hypothetical protein
MSKLKNIRLLNALTEGNMTTADLETALNTKSGFNQFVDIVNTKSELTRLSLSPKARAAVANSNTAMSNVIDSASILPDFLQLGVEYPYYGGYYAGKIIIDDIKKTSYYFVQPNPGNNSNILKWNDGTVDPADLSNTLNDQAQTNLSTYPWYPNVFDSLNPVVTISSYYYANNIYDGATTSSKLASETNYSELAAVKYCNDYQYPTGTSAGTLSDYFLPSIYELKMMDINKYKFNSNAPVAHRWNTVYSEDIISGQTAYPSYYWSSTESNSYIAWVVNFRYGTVDYPYHGKGSLI